MSLLDPLSRLVSARGRRAREEEVGVREEPFAGDGSPHPADVEPIVRGAVEIAGSAVGLGLAAVQPAARLPPIPYMGTAAGGLAFLEHQPRVRRLVEQVMGPHPPSCCWR